MRVHGFTLLELLVSISIFSVLGLGAYQMLDTVVDSHDRVRQTADSYTRMNLALTIIQRDMTQLVTRPVRDEYGEPLPPLVLGDEDYVVEFTRTGWANPASRQRSRLQRVAYSLDFEEEKLTRHFWTVLDRAEDSEPRSQVLLEGVTDFRVTSVAEDDVTDESSFDLDIGDAGIPVALEVVLATEALDEVTRVFQLAEAYVPERGVSEERTPSAAGTETPATPSDEGQQNAQ